MNAEAFSVAVGLAPDFEQKGVVGFAQKKILHLGAGVVFVEDIGRLLDIAIIETVAFGDAFWRAFSPCALNDSHADAGIETSIAVTLGKGVYRDVDASG